MSVEHSPRLADSVSSATMMLYQYEILLIDRLPIELEDKKALLTLNAWVHNPQTVANMLGLTDDQILHHLNHVWNNSYLDDSWTELERARGFGQDVLDD